MEFLADKLSLFRGYFVSLKKGWNYFSARNNLRRVRNGQKVFQCLHDAYKTERRIEKRRKRTRLTTRSTPTLQARTNLSLT